MRASGRTLAALKWSMETCQNGSSSLACSPRASVDLPELEAPLRRMILPDKASLAGAAPRRLSACGAIAHARCVPPGLGDGRTGVAAILPATVVHGRTRHRVTNPLRTYGSACANC